MCTVIFLKPLGLLSKSRDKEFATSEEIHKTSDVIAVRSVGADYFSLGINRHGVAFVSTAINSPAWTAAVMEGKPELARAIEMDERRGLSSPTKLISAHLHAAPNAESLIQRLTQSGAAWLGYNVILADRDGATVVEVHADRHSVRRLADRDAITNHFRDLDQIGPQRFEEYPNSYSRLEYAREHLDRIGSLDDLKRVLRPQDSLTAERIWRTGAFHTVSVSVLDLQKRALMYACGREGSFTHHSFAD
jgi:hypothetical protein